MDHWGEKPIAKARSQVRIVCNVWLFAITGKEHTKLFLIGKKKSTSCAADMEFRI
jgi:hypothetical protein